jgi:hypothetical protein
VPEGELSLESLHEATGADMATITACEVQHTSAEFNIAGFTTFVPLVPASRKTRVIILVKNDLAVRVFKNHLKCDFQSKQIKSIIQ